MGHLKRHLSVANVLSCLALFMAISGVAYAATLGKNAVKAKNIAKGAVTTPKLKNNSVTAAKLRNGAVIGSKIANEAVGASKLAPASVRSSALGGGVVTTGKLKDLAVTDGKLANNSVANAKLEANSVSTGKLQDGSVTAEKLTTGLLAQLLRNVSYESKTSVENAATGSKTVTAPCPAGKQVIGGGARVTGNGSDAALTESAPFVDVDGKRSGWTASARDVVAPAEPWGIEAHAICAEL